MSTRRPGGGPPPLIPDDPGAWAIVSYARDAQSALITGRGGRRQPTAAALLTTQPPPLPLRPVGLDPAAELAGAGPLRLVASSREGARALAVDPDGRTLRGIAPRVRRTWSLPDLVPGPPEYPEQDPVADVPPPVDPAELGQASAGEVLAPGGEIAAVRVRSGRLLGLALVRLPERALVRWIGGATAGAWSPDGRLLAVGGDWGVVLAEAVIARGG